MLQHSKKSEQIAKTNRYKYIKKLTKHKIWHQKQQKYDSTEIEEKK